MQVTVKPMIAAPTRADNIRPYKMFDVGFDPPKITNTDIFGQFTAVRNFFLEKN